MNYLAEAERAIAQIKREGRYRSVPSDEKAFVADFSTNDYLALSTDSRMVEAMRHVKTVGAGGARLLGGRHREHRLLEEDIARWLGRERALLFSSGYMAAVGTIPVLAHFADVIYSDRLNHASIIDGVRSARCSHVVYPHRALPRREERSARGLVISESLFGMDGDLVAMRTLLEDLHENDILLLDEAHALGILGPEGAGLAREFNDPRIVILGALGKGVGAAGGFIAGPAALVELLINTARTFIFDTALPPAIAFAARVGIMLARSAEDRRAQLSARAQRTREGLVRLGYAVPDARSPILPVPMGAEDRAVEVMQRCLQRGLYVPAIRPPTVPAGTSRLRISLRCNHTMEQIDLLLEELACTVSL